jgi:hypothetical protein
MLREALGFLDGTENGGGGSSSAATVKAATTDDDAALHVRGTCSGMREDGRQQL